MDAIKSVPVNKAIDATKSAVMFTTTLILQLSVIVTATILQMSVMSTATIVQLAVISTTVPQQPVMFPELAQVWMCAMDQRIKPRSLKHVSPGLITLQLFFNKFTDLFQDCQGMQMAVINKRVVMKVKNRKKRKKEKINCTTIPRRCAAHLVSPISL